MYRKIHEFIDIYEIQIINANDEMLVKISQELGLGLTLQEMKHIQEYFRKINRNPTDVELQTIAQTWSEHCFHKTFKGIIKTPDKIYVNVLKSFIMKVFEELKPSWVISAFEDNAGIVEFDENYAIAVKVETHNHPSAVEPFGGAATGVGGVIRDVLGVWAEPIALIDVLCFGPLNYPEYKLPKGIKHPKYIYRGVTSGIAYYGNNMGIPTIAGAIIFDEGYVGNVVVYCGCIGILPKNKYIRKVREGDYILIIGNKTGRDGLHGVIFASAELSEESEVKDRSAVQIPDPIVEESLRRAIIRIRDLELAHGITDLGGGGLSCAVCEIAWRYKLGAIIWLDKLHLRDPTLKPWEIWLSESQERMLLAIPPENLNKVIEILNDEEIEYSIVGKFTNTRKIEVYYKDLKVCDLHLEFLFNPPKIERVAVPYEKNLPEPKTPEPGDYNDVLLKLLSLPNIASKEDVIRMYDFEVGGKTVIKPLHSWVGGPSDGVVIKPFPHSWKGIVISIGIKPRYGKISTYWMTASAIDEAIRNNIAVGGRRIALLDNFTWGNPEKSDRMWDLLESIKACYEFAKYFETPFISGKDSLYNESPLGPVTSTLLITGIGIVPDIRNIVTIDLKKPGNYIYIIGPTYKELGGSEYYALHGYLGNSVPKVRKEFAKKIMDKVIELIDRKLIVSCHDISDGGLGVAISEMAFTGGYGVEIWLSKVPYFDLEIRNDYILFSESNSRFLIEVKPDKVNEVEEVLKDIPHACIGKVIKEPKLIVYGIEGKVIIELSINELLKAWKTPKFELYFRY